MSLPCPVLTPYRDGWKSEHPTALWFESDRSSLYIHNGLRCLPCLRHIHNYNIWKLGGVAVDILNTLILPAIPTSFVSFSSALY
jgi:hypothetical protein